MGVRRSGFRQCVAGVLCAATALVAPAAWAAEKPYGGATPQDAVARLKAGAEAGDFGEILAVLAPEDRKVLGGTMLMMTVMMVGFSQMAGEMAGGMAEGMAEAFGEEGEGVSAEQQAEIDAAKAEAAAEGAKLMAKLRAVLEPHGLAGLIDGEPEPGSDEDEAMERALEGADMVVLTQDLMTLLGEIDDDGDDADGGDTDGPGDEMQPPWVDDEVTGYEVEGDRATARAGDETIDFVRVDGRWYLKMPDEEPVPGEGSGAETADPGETG